MNTTLSPITPPIPDGLTFSVLTEAAAEAVAEYSAVGGKIACAESCTGGMIAAAITSVPGASAVFDGGAVSYANEIKSRVLGVSEDDLSNFGAVSAAVAEQMALGALRLFCPPDDGSRERSRDAAVAVTGIAGPGGGSAEKPVGTVYIAAATRSGVQVRHYRFAVPEGLDGDAARESVRMQTVLAALAAIQTRGI